MTAGAVSIEHGPRASLGNHIAFFLLNWLVQALGPRLTGAAARGARPSAPDTFGEPGVSGYTSAAAPV